ncbi:MAG: hypothetical protein ACRDYZ_11990 [Acidimicrobiales bacterium]
MLPTPTARDWKNVGDPDKTAARMADRGQPLGEVVVNALMPTPRATDGTKGGPNQRGSSGDLMLPSAVHLLPTPTVMDHKASGGNPDTTGTHGTTLTDATARHPDRWGNYAATVGRWETVTRPAPPPTAIGPKGKPRLSPRFTEWMMGLPDGWVTDVPGITRNEALKACGNGVVPQQAAAALSLLLRTVAVQVGES